MLDLLPHFWGEGLAKCSPKAPRLCSDDLEDDENPIASRNNLSYAHMCTYFLLIIKDVNWRRLSILYYCGKLLSSAPLSILK